MNRAVADPEWHGLIIWYFFLGGIAAGAYATACLARLFGDEADRRATRPAFYLAFPLVAICGVLLIWDLGRPERFWHMLIRSEVGQPMLKWWSPMSIGSWGLSGFGAFSFASFLGVLAQDGRLGLGRFAPLASTLERGRIGLAFEVGGLLTAFFLGAYTGTLLSASNQPVWADTTWIAPLFLASAASTGVAAVVLLNRHGPLRSGGHAPAVERLERLDAVAMNLEIVLLVALAVSLGGLAIQAFGTWPGILVPAVTVPLGLLIPLGLRWLKGAAWPTVGSALVLAGGFALRAAIVGLPPTLLGGHP